MLLIVLSCMHAQNGVMNIINFEAFLIENREHDETCNHFSFFDISFMKSRLLINMTFILFVA